MGGYPQFSFSISITLVKIYISRIIINWGKNTFELVGTVLNYSGNISILKNAVINFMSCLLENLVQLKIVTVTNTPSMETLRAQFNSSTTQRRVHSRGRGCGLIFALLVEKKEFACKQEIEIKYSLKRCNMTCIWENRMYKEIRSKQICETLKIYCTVMGEK